MKPPSVTFEPFDVVTLPFPFADRNEAALRPALVLTGHTEFGAASGIALVAMITSARNSAWPFDVPLKDVASAGLKVPSFVRCKVNAIDLALIERRIGALGADDRTAVAAALRGVLAGVLG